MRPKQHLKFLDGLRAIAALVVVVHHAWYIIWPTDADRPRFLQPLAFGKLAVTAFIVLSGFCLMLPIVQTSRLFEWKRFLRRRAQRILPPYYAALGMALLLDVLFLRAASGTGYGSAFPLTLNGLVSHLLLFQNLSANPFQIQGPLWSIAVECQIYLLFPLFVWTYKRWGILSTVCLTTVLGYTASLFFTWAGLPDSYAHYIAMFGIGMLSADLAFRPWMQPRKVVLACFAAFPVVAAAGLLLHHRFGSNKPVTDALMALVVGIVLVQAVLWPAGVVTRVLSGSGLVWVGEFSYSLYLIHNPLQAGFWILMSHTLHVSRLWAFTILSTVGTAAILLLSRQFFFLVEKRALQGSADGKVRVALEERLAA